MKEELEVGAEADDMQERQSDASEHAIDVELHFSEWRLAIERILWKRVDIWLDIYNADLHLNVSSQALPRRYVHLLPSDKVICRRK